MTNLALGAEIINARMKLLGIAFKRACYQACAFFMHTRQRDLNPLKHVSRAFADKPLCAISIFSNLKQERESQTRARRAYYAVVRGNAGVRAFSRSLLKTTLHAHTLSR